MSAKKKRQEAFKAKEKKQKIIAGVGGVLLLGVLAFQVPRMMKMMNKGGSVSSAVPAAVSTPTSTSPTPSLAAPTTLRGEESSSSSDSGTPSAISADASASEGQLASFSRFESKDPFQQQIDQSTTVASTEEPPPGSDSGSGSAGSSGSSGSTGASGAGGSQPAPGGAVISVNGVLMTVSVGSNFPAATPLFHLISVTTTTAKIAIAGGSYSSGASSVTLRLNKAVTLMNTADGTRYKLILKPQGTPVQAESAPTSTTSTTPTTPTTPAP